LHDLFSVEVADTSQAIEEAHRLRYQVYCVEYRYESSDTGLEIDEFDGRSRHIILRHQATGQAVGTVRLVPFGLGAGGYALPIQQICAPGTLDCFPVESSGEISRFAISKELRGLAGASVTPIQVGLMRGIVQVSRELGLTHWCAVMERSLLRLLRGAAIHFRPIGLPVAHHGLRQPAYGMIKQIMSRLRSERPGIWNFIDPDGLASNMPS
jgi:N-acyl-L-homoserine lactone synthetase